MMRWIWKVSARNLAKRRLYLHFITALILGVFSLSSAPATAGSALFNASSAIRLAGDEADSPRYPASLTKLMTIYTVLDAVARGDVSLDDKVAVSKYAASAPPSRLGLRAGQKISVRIALHAALTLSANDAARALAEAVSSSETAFAQRMNKAARAMGLRRSRFANATGLPDRAAVTTAAEMAQLVTRLDQRFGEVLRPMFRSAFTWAGQRRAPRNATVAGVEGALLGKTGYTCDAGYAAVVLIEKPDGALFAVATLANNNRSSRAQNLRSMASFATEGAKLAASGAIETSLQVIDGPKCGLSANAEAKISAPRKSKARTVDAQRWAVALEPKRNRADALASLDLAATHAPTRGERSLAVRAKDPRSYPVIFFETEATAVEAMRALRRNRIVARITPPGRYANDAVSLLQLR